MKHAVLLAVSLFTIAVATTPANAKKEKSEIPKPQQISSFGQAERDYDSIFAGRPAVSRIRVPGSLFISKPLNDLAPSSLLSRYVDIDIRSQVPTLADLQMLLEIQGVNISIDYGSLVDREDPDSAVGSFTAASQFQEVANSASVGSGVSGGGFDQNGFSQNNNGNGDGGGNGTNIIVEGAAEEEVAALPPPVVDPNAVPSILTNRLPFRTFRGTVGELMRQLENGGNIAVWYQNGLVVGKTRRYSVSLIQQKDIIQSVVNELKKLGANNVVGSVGAGQVFYSSPPRTNNEIIEPYLKRMSGNTSEVTLQLALVTVQMSRSAERGFDWSAFNFGLGSNVTVGPNSGVTDGTAVDGTTVSADTGLASGAFTINNSAFNANLGDAFGINRALSVAGAINFLSTIGNTTVAQNVELRTLSGSPVILRSGDDIPFVSGVGSTINNSLAGGALGSSQTSRLGTGLTLNVDPRYDHTSGIVTMDIGLKLVDLVEFIELNAGDQLGTLTQPSTREQGVNSIIRIPAGQTSILGGIRREVTSENRTGPFGLFGIGSKAKDTDVFWLFAIVRPVVTVYETSDSPIAPRSVLDSRTTVNPYDEGSYGAPGENVVVNTVSVPSPKNVVFPGSGTLPEINLEAPIDESIEEELPPIANTDIVFSKKPVENNIVDPDFVSEPQNIAEPVKSEIVEVEVQESKPRRSFIRSANDSDKE